MVRAISNDSISSTDWSQATFDASPEVRLQLTITEDESAPNQKACSLEELLLSNAPRRNGLILVPTKQRDVQVTLEMVREMSEDEY